MRRVPSLELAHDVECHAVPKSEDTSSLLWAAPERAEEIAALHAKLFDPPWDANAIKSLLEHPAATSLIAVAGEPKARSASSSASSPPTRPRSSRSGSRRTGSAQASVRRLLEGLARAARRGEAKRIFLEVAEDNAAGCCALPQTGFCRGGTAQALLRAPRGRSRRCADARADAAAVNWGAAAPIWTQSLVPAYNAR